MKSHIGPIPINPTFNPDASWQPLDEPSINWLLLVTLPFAVAATAALFILWFAATPLLLKDFWLSRGLFYTFYDDEWSRNRAIACYLAPFLTLSILPVLIARQNTKLELFHHIENPHKFRENSL